jgi:hypothetical protein
MRFWFIFAAIMGPRFFRRFIVLFALGMALILYALVRSATEHFPKATAPLPVKALRPCGRG